MKKLLLICPVIAALIFVGGACTMEDAGTVTVTNTTVDEISTNDAYIELDKDNYGVGEDVTVTVYKADLLHDTAWVGIVPSDLVHGDVETNDEYDTLMSAAVNLKQ